MTSLLVRYPYVIQRQAIACLLLNMGGGGGFSMALIKYFAGFPTNKFYS